AVEGIAEAAEHSTGTSCSKPWFIPNTVLSSRDACSACTANEVIISGGEITAFARSKIGQQFSIKPQDPHNAIRPGDFFAIDLPDSTGGADYRANIASCPNIYVRCSDFYSVKTGNMVGPTKQGVQDLIGNPPTDTWVSVGQYQTPYGLSDASKNVAVAPIWDTCGMAGVLLGGWFSAGA